MAGDYPLNRTCNEARFQQALAIAVLHSELTRGFRFTDSRNIRLQYSFNTRADKNEEWLATDDPRFYFFVIQCIQSKRTRPALLAELQNLPQSPSMDDIREHAARRNISLQTLLVKCWRRLAAETRKQRTEGTLRGGKRQRLDALNERMKVAGALSKAGWIRVQRGKAFLGHTHIRKFY